MFKYQVFIMIAIIGAVASKTPAVADLIGPVDETESPCTDNADVNCSAVGGVTWSTTAINDSESDFTGDWRWTVLEQALDADEKINDISITGSHHNAPHEDERLNGTTLEVTFRNVLPGATYAERSDQEYHLAQIHRDVLRASIKRLNDSSSYIHVNFLHDTRKSGRAPGDFNGDERLDPGDIDLLSMAIRDDSDDEQYDLNDDRALDSGDLTYMVQQLLQTDYGDADLNGLIDSSDEAIVRNNYGRPGGWSRGNFNLDFVTDAHDLAYLRANIDSVHLPHPAPEPSILVLGGVGLLLSLSQRPPR